LPTLAERLQAERVRLGMTQAALAQRTAVSLRTQRNYELGEAAPDGNYLAVLHSLGGDVLWVVSGVRASDTQPVLSPEELVVLERWRSASVEVRNAALGALLGAAKVATLQTLDGSNGQTFAHLPPKQVFNAPVGQVTHKQGGVKVKVKNSTVGGGVNVGAKEPKPGG
jgi:transcriptional regulator with XRE-family HTH domain